MRVCFYLCFVGLMSASCGTILFGHKSGKKLTSEEQALATANNRCYDTQQKMANPKNLSECITPTSEYCALYSEKLNSETQKCEDQ